MPGERPFYYVRDGGRFTLLQKQVLSDAYTIATMISEVEAHSLSSLLNTLYVEREEAIRVCNRWEKSAKVLAEMLSKLALTVDELFVNTHDADRAKKLAQVVTQAGDLLALYGQKNPG